MLISTNVINIFACHVHKMNLIQKDKVKEKEIKNIIDLAENVSSFFEKKPKVQFMFRQAKKYSGLNRINDYNLTQFLSLYNIVDLIMSSIFVDKRSCSAIKQFPLAFVFR